MKTPSPPPVEPDPIVEVRYETRLVCPAELNRPVPERPAVPPAAVVEVNEAGGDWLAAELRWADSVVRLFIDASEACQEAATP